MLFSENIILYKTYFVVCANVDNDKNSSQKANRASTHYSRTFVCKDYPGAVMSKNSIGSLLQHMGMDGSKRKKFYQIPLWATAADHHIAIDGTLKQNTSKVNDLSAFSYKARIRGTKIRTPKTWS